MVVSKIIEGHTIDVLYFYLRSLIFAHVPLFGTTIASTSPSSYHPLVLIRSMHLLLKRNKIEIGKQHVERHVILVSVTYALLSVMRVAPDYMMEIG